MFENSIIRRVGSLVDVGLLAETLFFYGSTQLVLDSSSIRALAKAIPTDDFKELITRASIKLSYTQQNFGVFSSGAISGSQLRSISGGASRKRSSYRLSRRN